MTAAVDNSDYLLVYNWLPATAVLGPFSRFALWTQGCGRRCPGCLAAEAQSTEGGSLLRVEELCGLILASGPQIEGLTISGGEPFLQAAALCKLIKELRRQRDLGLILYSGFTLEQLQERREHRPTQDLLSQIDLLIDGPYQTELDDGRALRGSANQRAIDLSGRYREHLPLYGAVGRHSEWRQAGGRTFLAGIPSPGALAAFRRQTDANG